MWRDTALRPRLFLIDARALFFLVPFLLHMQWWTGLLAALGVAFFVAVEAMRMTPEAALRSVRVGLGMLGRADRPSVPAWRRGRMRDFG